MPPTISRLRRPMRCSRCSRSRRPTRLFFLVSHAPGRLLPTIRSRCRRLDFGKLGDDAMTSLLSRSLPDEKSAEHRAAGRICQRLDRPGDGHCRARPGAAGKRGAGHPSPGRSRQYAAARSWRSALGTKAAADRYAAFLELVPGADRAGSASASTARRGAGRSTPMPGRARRPRSRRACRSTRRRPCSSSAASSPRSP